MYVDQSDDSTVHVSVSDNLATHEAYLESNAPDTGRIDVDLVSNTDEEIQSVYEDVNGDWGTIESEEDITILETVIDDEANKVGIGVATVDGGATSYLESEYGADNIYLFEAEESTQIANYTRYNVPHTIGGMMIAPYENNVTVGVGCTSGFPALDEDGNEYLFTAGHCVDDEERNWGKGWGFDFTGQLEIFDALGPGETDYPSTSFYDVGSIELFGGADPSKPRVFVKSEDSSDGYKFRTTSRYMKREHIVGKWVCYSGATRAFERCGKIKAAHARRSDVDVNIVKIRTRKRNRANLGDSGSPVYKKLESMKAAAAGILMMTSDGQRYAYFVHAKDAINHGNPDVDLYVDLGAKYPSVLYKHQPIFYSRMSGTREDRSDNSLEETGITDGVSEVSSLLSGDADAATSYNPSGHDSCTVYPFSPVLSFGGDFTIEAWIYSTGRGPQFVPTIASRANSASNWGNFNFKLTGSAPQNLALSWRTVGGSQVIEESDGTVSQNAIHHVAATWNKSAQEVKFYIDGSLSSTEAFTSGQASREVNDEPMHIGCLYRTSSPTASGEWEGTVDDVSMYNEVLDGATIADHYQGGS
jgi:hypothetical protein